MTDASSTHDLQPSEPKTGTTPGIRSLRELIDIVSGKSTGEDIPGTDAGLAESLPFPFFGLVGQQEMKLALILAIINPAIGGVLLIGPRGTGKTTAVRSLLDLLPSVTRSACFYGCLPEDIEAEGIDAVCPDCARKYGQGIPLVREDRASLVELPLNARIEDVVGGLDERAAIHDRMRLKRGILAHADQNILYIDEVNLLQDDIIDTILDASAMGAFTVRRGVVSATYRSRFVLIGTMNPEEGGLRPQIMDRFGLRVIVKGLKDPADRFNAYQRVSAYRQNPRRMIRQYRDEISQARNEIENVRLRLPQVTLPKPVAYAGLHLVQDLGIDSLRAEITMFEAARAYTASDDRDVVTIEDLHRVAPLALRLRRSEFITRFFHDRQQEDEELNHCMDKSFSQDNLDNDKGVL